MLNEKEARTVSWFEHENALMHYGRVNKRSLIALVSVCITCILIVTIFVIGYTIRERDRSRHEQYLVETIIELSQRPAVAEVSDGISEQPNP